MENTLTPEQRRTLETMLEMSRQIYEMCKVLATTEDPFYFGLKVYAISDFEDSCEELLERNGI